MPNIREYTASDVTIRPDERGMQALSREAGALSSEASSTAALGQAQLGAAQARASGTASIGKDLGQGIADVGHAYVKWETNKQVSAGAASLASMTDDLTQVWNQAAKDSDPNDQSVAPAFREKTLEPALDKFVQGFSTEEGQQWARQQTNSMRQHFYEKTAADQATRAGMAAQQNFGVMTNRLSNLAMSDPTSGDMALGLVDTSVTALVNSNPNISAEQAEKLRSSLTQTAKEQIAKSAIVGLIDKNPDAGLAALSAGKYADYLDGTTKKSLEGYATEKKNSLETQARLDEAAEQRRIVAAAKTDQNAIYTTTIQPDGSIALPPDYMQKVMDHRIAFGGAGDDAAEMIRFGVWAADQKNKPDTTKTDPGTYADFATRLNLADNDPKRLSMTEVSAARRTGFLSDSDFQHFADGVAKPSTPAERQKDKTDKAYVDSFKSAITSSAPMGLHQDAVGDQMFYQFQINATRIRTAYEKANKSEDEIQAAIRGSIPAFTNSKATSRKGATAPNVLPAGPGYIIPKKPELPAAAGAAKKETPEEVLKRLGL